MNFKPIDTRTFIDIDSPFEICISAIKIYITGIVIFEQNNIRITISNLVDSEFMVYPILYKLSDLSTIIPNDNIVEIAKILSNTIPFPKKWSKDRIKTVRKNIRLMNI